MKNGKFCAAGVAAFTGLLSRVQVFASEVYTVDPNFLKEKGNDTFKTLTDTVKGLAASATNLITYFAIFVLVIAVILAAIGLVSNNAAKKEGAKARLGSIIIAAILVFSSLAIILFAQNLGNDFAAALTSAAPTATPIE